MIKIDSYNIIILKRGAKVKKIVLLMSFILLFFCACGVPANRNEHADDTWKEDIVVLSQRQKDILDEQGLPREYEELILSQQNK